jgi:hypothetical protein
MGHVIAVRTVAALGSHQQRIGRCRLSIEAGSVERLGIAYR